MVSTEESENPLPSPGMGEMEDGSITQRDGSILQAVQDEGLTVFTFDGLKRLLGMHQEMLSRVLDRLEDEGLVEKVAEGYRVTQRGREFFPQPLSSTLSRIPIVQSLLPRDIDMRWIVSRLKGRWFGSLRWLGYSQTDEGVVLKWIAGDEGIQVDAKFSDTLLSIEAKVGEGKEVSHAIKASHQLLGYISRLYDGPQRARNFASPVVFYQDMAFA